MRLVNLLQPLAFHQSICQYLQQTEPKLWEWFIKHRPQSTPPASQSNFISTETNSKSPTANTGNQPPTKNEAADAIRLDLLKRTYRLMKEAEPKLYQIADQVAEKLNLAVPITIYQAQNPEGLNASLAYIPGEAHLVLHGPVSARLDDLELKSLFAHELGHLIFLEYSNHEMLVTEQILAAMTHDRQAEAVHFSTARLFGLYTEIFCDRVALSVVGRATPVISMLIKITTGLDKVDAASTAGLDA